MKLYIPVDISSIFLFKLSSCINLIILPHVVNVRRNNEPVMFKLENEPVTCSTFFRFEKTPGVPTGWSQGMQSSTQLQTNNRLGEKMWKICFHKLDCHQSMTFDSSGPGCEQGRQPSIHSFPCDFVFRYNNCRMTPLQYM